MLTCELTMQMSACIRHLYKLTEERSLIGYNSSEDD